MDQQTNEIESNIKTNIQQNEPNEHLCYNPGELFLRLAPSNVRQSLIASGPQDLWLTLDPIEKIRQHWPEQIIQGIKLK